MESELYLYFLNFGKMKNNLRWFVFLSFVCSAHLNFAQTPCAFDADKAKNSFSHHPASLSRLRTPDAQLSSVVTIPVVVHIVWHAGHELCKKRMNNSDCRMNTDMLTNGIYFLKIAGENYPMQTFKVIVSH